MSTAAGIAEATVVRAWRDPDFEHVGFSPLSRYVETVWLPVAGPSATWAYRRLGALAVVIPDGVSIDLSVMARDLGLASTEGPSKRFFHALDRLERFGLLVRFDAEFVGAHGGAAGTGEFVATALAGRAGSSS